MSNDTGDITEELEKHFRRMLSKEVGHYLDMCKRYDKVIQREIILNRDIILSEDIKDIIDTSKQQIINLVIQIKAYKK